LQNKRDSGSSGGNSRNCCNLLIADVSFSQIMCWFKKKKNTHEETKQIMEEQKLIVDKRKIERADGLYEPVKRAAIRFMEMASRRGLNCGIFCGYRSVEHQNELYSKGRTIGGKIVTNAKGGYSFHNYGLAIDIVFIDDSNNWTWESDEWQIIGEIGKSIGFEWGGDWNEFKDFPHFQMSFDCAINTLFEWYQAGGLNEVWKNLNGRN